MNPRINALERVSEQTVVGEDRVVSAVRDAGESLVRAAFRGEHSERNECPPVREVVKYHRTT